MYNLHGGQLATTWISSWPQQTAVCTYNLSHDNPSTHNYNEIQACKLTAKIPLQCECDSEETQLRAYLGGGGGGAQDHLFINKYKKNLNLNKK